jgi:RecA/RadA recombinase
VSAAQALQDLQHGKGRCISTGLPRLDVALSGVSTVSRDASDGATTTSAGGVERGVVTEIWGPPGAGKTALG